MQDKMNTLLNAMFAHNVGQETGTFDNKLLNQILSSMLPEVGAQDSILETEPVFSIPNDTGFVEDGLQKRIWRDIIIMAYPEIGEPSDALIESVAALSLARLNLPDGVTAEEPMASFEDILNRGE